MAFWGVGSKRKATMSESYTLIIVKLITLGRAGMQPVL